MKKRAKAGLRFFFLVASIGAMGFAAKAKAPLHSPKTKLPFNPGKALKNFSDSTAAKEDNSFRHIDTRYKAAVSRLKQQADALRSYLEANNYNTEFCFLIDMSIPSGKKRFFIYNLKTNTVMESSMVSHGIGSRVKGSDEELQFSNDASSLRTSLGRYKVGGSYTGNYGTAFKLYGLDKTNSNAYDRAIVLHAHYSIPSTETYPVPIGESFGCPSVAPEFLNTLSGYIKGSSKPVMMWIYN